MKKLRKEQRGITLIALVVTIVVLLILAGITINMLLDDNGIIQKAQDASNKMNEAEENELMGLNELYDQIDAAQGKVDVPKKLKGASKPDAQNETEDVGMAEDGSLVNLDLWYYKQIGDSYTLVATVGSGGSPAYREPIVGGKIEGEIPMYIKEAETGEIRPVTSIGREAFLGLDLVTAPKIPSTVTSIEDCAFYRCINLRNVKMPSTVTSIGDDAFGCCRSLTNITIPSSVTSIGECAFKECTSLTNITIPSSVTSIENKTFMGCTSLKNITIPNSITNIGVCAFEGCTSLSNITIPSSVMEMGDLVFRGCTITVNVPFKQGEQPDGWNVKWDSTDGYYVGTEWGTVTINYTK